MDKEIEVQVDPEEVGYPDWYLENYKLLEAFLALDQGSRNELVGEASGLFGTILSALTPEGHGAVISSGKGFLDANIEATGEKFANFPKEILLYLMLGVAIETIGIQQMRLEAAKQVSDATDSN